MITLLVACVAPDPALDRGCDLAESDAAVALCEACDGDDGCRAFLADPDRVRLTCEGARTTASIVWALDRGEGCVLRDVEPPPDCPPPTEGVLAIPDGLEIRPNLLDATGEEFEASLQLDRGDRSVPLLAEILREAVAEVVDDEAERLATPSFVKRQVKAAGGLPEGEPPLELDDVLKVEPRPQGGDCCAVSTVVDLYVDHGQTLLDDGRNCRLRLLFGNPADELSFEGGLSSGAGVDLGDLPIEMAFQARAPVGEVDPKLGIARVEEVSLRFVAGRPPFLPEEEESCRTALDDEDECDLELPPQPWEPDTWLAALLTGVVRYDGGVFAPTPSVVVSTWLPPEAVLRPTVVAISTRRRFTVQLRFPGVFVDPCLPTSPETCMDDYVPVFLVSLDETDVMAAEPWLAFVRGATHQRPPVLGRFLEVEIERLRPWAPDGELLAPGGEDVVALLEPELIHDHGFLIEAIRVRLAEVGAAPEVVLEPKVDRAVAAAQLVRGEIDGLPGVGGGDAIALLALVTADEAPPAAGDLDLDNDVDRDDVQRLVEFAWLAGTEAELAEPWPTPGIPCH